jgi:hypothetical protein
MLVNKYVYNGEIVLRKYDTVTINKEGTNCGYGATGTPVNIVSIDPDDNVIGLQYNGVLKNWNISEENISTIKISIDTLMSCFSLQKESSAGSKCISEDYNVRGVNLKGMPCTILKSIAGSRDVFVEFEENINAGGCDGLGKSGHCLAVDKNLLVPVKKKKSIPASGSKKKKKAKGLFKKNKIEEIKVESSFGSSIFAEPFKEGF